ncbi:MAG: hypothetical protein H6744_13720 [Deltaproteobacteria bacterium]|nr:hypothetical protein [Deltaproteobacteria bacterium]
MDLINRIANTRFLGREFLTWLWFRSERQEGLFSLDDERTIEVWFDARLTLEALGDIKEQNVIKSESPTETEEARASLQTGKQVKEARLRVVFDQKQWTATIKADDLSLHGLKIPAVLSREEDDQVYERFDLLEEIEDLIDALFRLFRVIRLDDDAWRAEVADIREWVRPT